MSEPRRRLILLRHAKAERAAAGSSYSDQLRPLAPQGRRDCAVVGAELVAGDYIPDLVLVSSAVRTQQTWELVDAALGNRSAAEVEISDDFYHAGVVDLVERLAQVDERTRTVLVVGHEPVMSGTAFRLASADSESVALAQVRAGLPTSACAVLRVVNPWSEIAPGSAQLAHVLSGRG